MAARKPSFRRFLRALLLTAAALGAALNTSCTWLPHTLRVQGELPGAVRLDFQGRLEQAFPRLSLEGTAFAEMQKPFPEGALPDLWIGTDRAFFEALQARNELHCLEPPPSPDERCFFTLGLTALVLTYDRSAQQAGALPARLPERWTDTGRHSSQVSHEGLANPAQPLRASRLSDALRARSSHPGLRVIYPLDGAVPVPIWMAISQKARHSGAAEQLVRWLLQPVAQNALIRAGFHSKVPGMAYPEGARPLPQLGLFLPVK